MKRKDQVVTTVEFTRVGYILQGMSHFAKRVLVVGAGFAGLKAAKALSKSRDVQVTLIDRRNHHLFQPLLYQVATAGLSPAEIATPIRTVFANRDNVKVLMGNIESVILSQRQVSMQGELLDYDYLILACGAKHSYFNHPEWENDSPGLKTLEQATEIRRRILLAFELAERAKDPVLQKELLTFIVVGGGPTGVEMAGAIGEISRYTLEKDFRAIRPDRTRVLLVEAGSRILPAFSEVLSKRAARDLERLGVQIWTSTRVTEVNAMGIKMGNEEVRARTVIWAAGVKPSSLSQTMNVELDSVGRVKVQKDLSLPGHPEVMVLGDQAHFPTKDGKGLPGLAPVAMQQGTHAASNILADLRQRPRQPFVYRDKGIMATIGRKSAIVQIGRLQYGGFFAWLTWLFIHIYYLIGFKNRIFVFAQWAWAYLTFKRGARLILDKEWRSNPQVKN
ncbi:MAG: NAD(P)/FAD-dependent oxidoreductase [Bdellovibrionales bacterium]